MKHDDTNLELDAILRRATAMSPGPPTSECADPEMLAAYYDRSLAEPDRDRLEAHFADCARCQAQLAAIARADEAASSARPRLGVSRLRPLIAVPALAAAAALLVVVRSMRTSNNESRRSEQVAIAKHEVPLTDLAARAPVPVSPPAAATAPSAPASNEIVMNEAKHVAPPMAGHRHGLERRDELRARAMPLAKEPPPLPKSEREAVASAPSRYTGGDVASNEAAQVSGSPISSSAQIGAVSAPLQAGSAETAVQSRQPPSTATPPYAMSKPWTAPRAFAGAASLAAPGNGASEVGSGAPVGAGAATGAGVGTAIGAGAGAVQLHVEQATSGSAGAGIGTGTGAIVGSAMPRAPAAPEALAMISPPDRSVGWQVGRDGMIVRRDADGRTHPQHSGVTTDLSAGAAPSSTVCWIVGRSGTIIRTTDGEHWELVASPSGDNLVRVASDSADHAIVTTASGQNFETSDGGTSWHPR